MRQPVLLTLCLIGATALAGCQGTRDAASKRALKSVNVVDESNLSDIIRHSPSGLPLDFKIA